MHRGESMDISASSHSGLFPTSIEPDGIRLPARRKDSHKYDYGRTLIIAGSVGYTGAPCLAANAAERSGAGLVTLAVPSAIYSIAAIKADGAVVRPLPGDADGRLSSAALDVLLPLAEKADACLIGPGLGQSGGITDLLDALLGSMSCPLVLDADGINTVSSHIDWLDRYRGTAILTPHEGEFARLIRSPITDRTAQARSFSAEHGCITVLKGSGTIIAAPDGRCYINGTGGPALAKGGSGDVLAGILTALLGQGMEPVRAACTAVWLHGRSGDMAADRLSEYCVTPGDVISFLPEAFKELC